MRLNGSEFLPRPDGDDEPNLAPWVIMGMTRLLMRMLLELVQEGGQIARNTEVNHSLSGMNVLLQKFSTLVQLGTGQTQHVFDDIVQNHKTCRSSDFSG